MWAVLVAAVLVGGCTSSSGGGNEPGTGTPSDTPSIPADHVEFASVVGIDKSGVEGVRRFPTQSATLRGPHFSYTVKATATLSKLTPDQAEYFELPAGAAPAPGHEILLAELEPARGYLPADAAGTAPQRVEVLAGSVSRRLELRSTLIGTIVMSVPAGSKPVLRVTDAGRPQSLDLTTGKRGPDAATGYYPVREVEWRAGNNVLTGLLLSGPGAAGMSTNERVAGIQLSDADGTLVPYVEGRGWAEAGRAWLALGPEVQYSRLSAGTDKDDQITVDLRSFTVTGPGGTRYPVSGKPIVIGGPTSPDDFPIGQNGAGRLLVDVPATLRRATLSFTFTGTIRLPKGPVSWSIYANRTRTGALVAT